MAEKRRQQAMQQQAMQQQAMQQQAMQQQAQQQTPMGRQVQQAIPQQSSPIQMMNTETPNKNNSVPEPEQTTQKIGSQQIAQAGQILQKYKRGKAFLERKIIENEEFWKLRHWESARGKKKHTPATAWLWNVIVAKHADMEDSYPEAGFLARAQDDVEEAKRLSSVIPVILEQNEFDEVYSDCAWYKLKQGAACYGVFWDKDKSGGLGDISIKKIDLINLFWEPGITDIQDSQNVFHVELVNNNILEALYPQLEGQLGTSTINISKYLYDDSVDTSEKSCVVDWYYHKGTTLHYCKYVNDTVLFASENDPQNYPNGWYQHGKFPFVIDSLYDIEGSICGYGYTDICKDTQVQIDLLSDAVIKNARIASKPRFFYREDGSINIEEFADIENEFIKVTGNLGEDSIRQIEAPELSSNYITILQNKIDELKETSGNRDVSNGSATGGVTAASAITALQEAGSKVNRDVIKTTYKAYKKIIYMVIELIREFYSVSRQFRITGESGQEEFITYDNSALVPQSQGSAFGVDMGYRVPCFDIEVSPQTANPYNKMSQNELALQFYQLGFFNPDAATQALACLEVMDFNTKDKLVSQIKQNGTIQQQLMTYAQLAYNLAVKFAPDVAAQLAPQLEQMGVQAQQPAQNTANIKSVDMAQIMQGQSSSAQPY